MSQTTTTATATATATTTTTPLHSPEADRPPSRPKQKQTARRRRRRRRRRRTVSHPPPELTGPASRKLTAPLRPSGGWGASQLWSLVVSSSVFFRGDRGAQRLTRVRKCALSGRDFVRKEFCQEGILSGRNFVGWNFVRQEFCRSGLSRKRALPGRRVSFGVCLLLGERCEKLEAD